ncbi:MAG: AsmA family protein [Burkholderiaceae bacterium]
MAVAAICVLAIPAVALIVLINFDWNRAKPWLNARTSEAIGRTFTIVGDVSLTWKTNDTDQDESWRGAVPWPHLVAQDIRIGDPATLSRAADTAGTASPADMAHIQQFSFSLNPFALLEKKIVIPLLRFDSAAITLRREPDGKNNWTFTNDDTPSPWKLNLQRVVFTKGSIHLIDQVKHIDVMADIDTINDDPIYGITWQVHGKFNGAAINGSGKAGALLALQHQKSPYHLMGHLRMGKTMIAVEGTLTKPTDLAALDMHLKLSGTSMAELYHFTGLVLPETPPYATEGHLIGTLGAHRSHWIYQKFSGKVGSSDISGSLDYQAKQPRPLLSGTVVSHRLYFPDLAPIIGADSNTSKAKRDDSTVQPTNKALPVEPFKTERWTSIDADIKFSAESIIRNEQLPIKALTTNLHLQDGVLTLLPLNFDIAGGAISSDITLDGSGRTGKNAIKAQLKMTASHLKIQQLFPKQQSMYASVGEIDGQASLSAVGNSVGNLLGNANGEIRTLINQGSISKLLLEEIGLNIGNVILTSMAGDKQIKLNCMATDFGVTNGLMQTRSFIIDTDDAILNVNGTINLTQEQLDLTIKPKSKGLRVFSLRAPIYVQGSFKQPKVSVDKGVMAMRVGGAIALAAIAPVALLIPLVNVGPQENSECAALLAAARTKPVAPTPGKAYVRKSSAK